MQRLKRAVLFILTLAGLALALKVMGWLPLAVEKGSPRGYRSIEEVREELRPHEIYLPSYFPQYLKWPPSEIYAGIRPSFSILMHFTHQRTGDVVLSISQSASGKGIRSKIEPARVLREEDIEIKGRPAVLYLALCEGGEPCNKVTLKDGGYTLSVIAKDAASEAVKTAESMLPAN